MKSDISFKDRLPAHIAFIMDGNGRWAKKRMMPRNYGHRAGVAALKKLASDVFGLGIPYMTVYAFSTENKQRPKDEVDGLIKLLRDGMEELTEEIIAGGVRVCFIGDLSFFPSDVNEVLGRVERKSRDGKNGVLTIALNYGGRDEIARAAKSLAETGGPFDADSVGARLYTADLPDPDMIVRTGGEMRLSNFMLYQAAYSELFFVKTLWPDFGKKELLKLLKDYAGRNRRFGKVQ